MATIDMEQLDGVVGCFCTLLYPRRGQTEGTIVEDLGCEVIVQLINGKEVTEYKDDVVICEAQNHIRGSRSLSSFDCKNSFRTILQ